MVLDDGSPQAGRYSENNVSASSPAQQSMAANPAMARNFHLRVKPELVVRPDLFTMVFGFLGPSNWARNVAYTMMERVENSWLLTGRAITQDELDAFTTHSTRTLYYRRLGVPISSFIGTAYLYNKFRKDAGLPSNASPRAVFTFLRKYASVDKAGFRSMIASSAFKMLFITTAGAIGSGFAALYSETKSVISDPRLKNFVEDMRGQKPEEVRQRKLQAASERIRRMRGGEKDIEGYIFDELKAPGSHPEQNDQDQYANDNSASETASPGNDMKYNTSQDVQQRPMPEAPRRSWGYGGGAGTQQGGTDESSADPDFFFGGKNDDASPTAPEYRNTNPDGSPIGSAWERLRRQNGGQSSQAAAPRQPRPQWGQQQDSPNSPTYTPSGDRDQFDYDRSREKEQAQADFDRMMDAERNIPNDQSSQNRGW
ncbi:uncharacterized protein N7482_006835 [Penicillium canariense]|uniref:Endo-1,3(4)-beta-glucanase n=1 Tax=Penicillium canariense TaxID=189055 RepID=A0A9W9HYB4_9EURO|nr:uncharacterized protein N7482_006835 [Penicillium canariense]KAJ5159831.1 hypothetical protein N7482_006835 [Penicillium canariense]